MSSKTFADLGISDAVVRSLADSGITSPFAIQSLVIPDVLDGRDVLGKSPTGSGKTLAFGVPMCELLEAEDRRPAALVLAPTRELAVQIADELRPIASARALKLSLAYGGVGIQKQINEAKRSHILIATPGRLEDLIQRGAVELGHVRILVLDEADRMLDMGFRPAVDRIVRRCPRDRQTLFFSATLDGEVGRIAGEYTDDAVRREHAPPPRPATDIQHRFVPVSNDGRMGALVEQLGEAEGGRSLVFVRTKRGADRLVKRLDGAGISALAMHGNKSQNQRQKALDRFRSGNVVTLVATDVAARGIDVDDISHVINFDPPGDHETYVHRVGRTGRAGRTGTGVTLVDPQQVGEVGSIARRLKLHDEFGHISSTAPKGGSRGGGNRSGGGGNGGSRNGGPRKGGSHNGGSAHGSGANGSRNRNRNRSARSSAPRG
ncbi:MAG: DEAD/DEAH box helicase [Solirubrobacterales bacterium]